MTPILRNQNLFKQIQALQAIVPTFLQPARWNGTW